MTRYRYLFSLCYALWKNEFGNNCAHMTFDVIDINGKSWVTFVGESEWHKELSAAQVPARSVDFRTPPERAGRWSSLPSKRGEIRTSKESCGYLLYHNSSIRFFAVDPQQPGLHEVSRSQFLEPTITLLNFVDGTKFWHVLNIENFGESH